MSGTEIAQKCGRQVELGGSHAVRLHLLVNKMSPSARGNRGQNRENGRLSLTWEENNLCWPRS